MKKLRLRLNVIGYIVLLVLAGGLLFQMCTITNQATAAFAMDAEFAGEYSLGGSEWKPLEKNTRFSSFDGDLVLRGKFTEQSGMNVRFYLNHIGVTISVNNEEVLWCGRSSDEIPEIICGSSWSGWLYEMPQPEDEIEIRLHNPHKYGNPNAYNQFLDSMTLGGGTALESRVKHADMPYTIAGIIMLVISVALLGMALGYLTQRLSSGSLLWSMGLTTLLMGGYILMDNMDIFFRSNLIVFNTCVRQCCIMFAALGLADCTWKILTGKGKKIAGYITAALGAAEGILLVLSLADVISIYDTGIYWAAAQGLVSLLLLGLCVLEIRKQEKENRVLLVSGMILQSVVLLELFNGRTGWWRSGIVVKVIFVLLLVFHLIRAVKQVAVNHRASVRAKELAEELRNSRIVLAMSQIRTHFIFNILTAISGMCEYDPKKADDTLIRFSRYLRSNIDIMQEDEPESFSRTLEHLENYIALEQVRFGEKIQFVKHLEITDFRIPPLILQPVVENAIRHGLLPKPSGGTIGLYTDTDGRNVIITVADDGVGFDTENAGKEGSVGLENVRFRLEHMMNGKIEIESRLGEGTTVTITIPYKEAVK